MRSFIQKKSPILAELLRILKASEIFFGNVPKGSGSAFRKFRKGSEKVRKNLEKLRKVRILLCAFFRMHQPG